MRKPDESLDDYIVKALPESTEPPQPVSLRFTGEVEVLKPLARWERPAKLVPAAVVSAPHAFSWFHRSLVMGGGFALGALVLASAIAIGVSDSTRETAQIDFVDVTGVPESKSEAIAAPEETLSADIFTNARDNDAAVPVTARKRKQRPAQARIVRASAPVKAVVRNAVVKPKLELDQSLVSRFLPTTLVIYVENGTIRTRTEPWTAHSK